jgi:hypothetical protein
MPTRAKVRCNSVQHFANDMRICKFTPVADDGTPENERYHRYTPGGSLELAVDNPAVTFEPGRLYYVDITEADAT